MAGIYRDRLHMGGICFVLSDAGEFLKQDYPGNCSIDSPTVYVFPDVVSAAEARRILLDVLPAINGRQFMTLDSVASTIVQNATGVPPRLVDDCISELIARDVFRTMAAHETALPLSFSGPLLRDYAAVRPFFARGRKWLTEIVSGTGIGFSEANVRRKIGAIDEFSDIFEQRMDLLEKRGLYDRTRLITRATENAVFPGAGGIQRVVFLFLTYSDVMVTSFIESLAKSADVVIVLDSELERLESIGNMRLAIEGKPKAAEPSTPIGRNVNFFGAPDRRRELTEVARRIKSEMAKLGLKESDFAVLSRNIADYEEYAQEVFAEYGLSVQGGGKRRFTDARLFNFVERFLRCLQPDSSKMDMYRLLVHDLSPVGQEQRESIAALTELMPEYLNDWSYSLSDLRHNRRKALREIDISFIESILKLRSEIGLKNKLAGWIEITLNLASFARIPRRERADSAELILSLRELTGYSAPLTDAMDGGDITLNEFIEFIKSFGSAETLSAGGRIKGVLFTDVGIVYLRRFSHCFILGMNEGVFPSIPAEGTFLTQAVIDAIALSGFPTRRSTASHSSVETYYYGRVKNLSAEITLSYLTCDAEGRKILPSQFVIDDCAGKIHAAEILEWLDHRSIPAGHFFPADNEPVLCKPELKNVIADRIREDAGFLTVEANSELWKMTDAPQQDSFLEAVGRMNSVPLPWNLSADNATRKKAASRFSPSDLNEYSACPFRFFLTRILKLYPRQEIFGYMSRGTDAHEILRTYFSRRKLDDFRKESDESISAEVDAMVRERYIREYGEQCLNGMDTVIGMDTLASVLKNFLISERRVQSSLSTEVVMLERNFGFNGHDSLRIGEFEFRGKIDRVDTLHAGSHDVVIFDYKFTRPDALKSRHFNSTWGKPKNFELPVYSLYLKDVMGYNIAGALYYSLPKSGGKFDRAGFVEESKIVRFIPDIPKRKNTQISVLSEKEMEETLELYRKSVVETAQNIREGKFPVTPEKGECDNCRHMAFCRNWGGSDGQDAT